MNKLLAVLFAISMAPVATASAEYRAIVQADALSQATLNQSESVDVLHTYQPGDVVILTESSSCSSETCEAILPSGEQGWVANHKITAHSDLAVERKYYQQVDWDSIDKFELRIWADGRDEPEFAYACAIALESGAHREEQSLLSLCPKFRNTREVQEAAVTVREAMENLDQENRQLLFNGGAPIGAPKVAVLLSWGKPNDTRRTITKNMVTEQMIYDDRTAHIENGTLVKIEE